MVIRARLFAILIACVAVLTGCDDFILQNPLPSSTDDRITGSWADERGQLAFLIKRGPENQYQFWSADDFKQGKEPSIHYLAETGGMIFEEHPTSCTGHTFEAPSEEETPKGCWAIQRLIVTDQTLVYYPLDTMEVVRRSVAGGLPEISYRYGVSAGKSRPPSAEVLLEGSERELSSFIAVYAKGPVYGQATKYHRIG